MRLDLRYVENWSLALDTAGARQDGPRGRARRRGLLSARSTRPRVHTQARTRTSRVDCRKSGAVHEDRSGGDPGGPGPLRRLRDLRRGGRPAAGQGRARGRRLLPHHRRRRAASARPSTRACSWCTCRPCARSRWRRSATPRCRSRTCCAHPVDVAHRVQRRQRAVRAAAARAGIPVATHVDGLEWKRSKWQGAGQRYYRLAESMAVRWSDALIADAQGIADYYRMEFDADTELIAYGAPIIDAGRGPSSPSSASSRAATTSSSPASSRRTTSTSSSTATGAAAPTCRSWWSARRPTPTSTPRGSTRSPTTGALHSAASGTRNCWTSSTPTARPTCTGTRSAARTRRCCAPSAPARPRIAFDVDFNREVLRRQRPVLPHRRRRRRARSSSPRQHPDETARRGALARELRATATTGTTSPPATSRCAHRWSSPARVRVRHDRPAAGGASTR